MAGTIRRRPRLAREGTTAAEGWPPGRRATTGFARPCRTTMAHDSVQGMSARVQTWMAAMARALWWTYTLLEKWKWWDSIGGSPWIPLQRRLERRAVEPA